MCKHYKPSRKLFDATSASRRENVHIKTRLGKLAPMGAALVGARDKEGGHKGRPYGRLR
jgi:hypothetical protein